MAKKIIVSVISDVVTDQRVQKECDTLQKMGFDITIVGRKSKRDFELDSFPFKMIRFRQFFHRGPLMYLEFNSRLLFYLLFTKTDLLWSNDLDTLLPNYLVSRLKSKILIYDSHELFVASVHKRFSKKVWQILEDFLFPKMKNVITVNESIKKIYENKYRVFITVIRNVPFRFIPAGNTQKLLPSGKINLVMQGMGINEHRGAEEAVMMMEYLPQTYNLFFIGSGTVLPRLKKMVTEMQLESKVHFIDPMPYLKMMEYTKEGFIGLILEKTDVSGEHLYSLPNRLFDYIQAGLPILTSKAVEIVSILNDYQIGTTVDAVEPKTIAAKILEISADTKSYELWKQNMKAAADNLNWENEENILVGFMSHLS